MKTGGALWGFNFYITQHSEVHKRAQDIAFFPVSNSAPNPPHLVVRAVIQRAQNVFLSKQLQLCFEDLGEMLWG